MAEKPSLSASNAKPAEAKPRPTAAAPRPSSSGDKQDASGAVHKTRRGKAVGVREEMDERKELGAFHIWMREAVKNTPSWLVSMVFHMIVLLILALWTMPENWADEARQLVVANTKNEEFDELEELIDEPLEEIDVEMTAIEDVVQEDVNISPDDVDAAAMSVDLSDFGLDKAPRNDLLATVGGYYGTGLSGRGTGNRGALVRRAGGTAASEKAVAAALKWLAIHQMPDGGWCFDLKKVPSCRGKCRNSGDLGKARIGATAMAVLPFLGAGQTHVEGKDKATVRSGLYFLVNHMKVGANGGSLHEGGGNMYSHGLASIALCEAYAMTDDKGLHNPAQAAVNFICYAQDPVGGGWRYKPRQPGDTSVVGWQIMALKSGHMAYLRVPPATVKRAFAFLDSVQANSGATYGYTSPGTGKATTAIGLLCRMYLGWKKDYPALQRGAKMISKWGPSKSNMYYNYYATQVMRHVEGDMWKKWNSVMRDQLVNSQSKNGHETGSWFMGNPQKPALCEKHGGRLYCTSMATMVLEVYYRHMPIYGKESIEEDFKE